MNEEKWIKYNIPIQTTIFYLQNVIEEASDWWTWK